MANHIGGFFWYCAQIIIGAAPILYLAEVGIDTIRRMVTVD